MTERIRSLFDAAIADVRPRTDDPVPEVLLRGQAARRRNLIMTGGASIAAVAVIATGVLVADNWIGADAPPANQDERVEPLAPPWPSERPTEQPGWPSPLVDATVTESEVKVNGLLLELRNGWQAVQADGAHLTDCEVDPQSIIINVGGLPGGDCNARAQIEVNGWPQSISPEAFEPQPELPTDFERPDDAAQDHLTAAEVILPGGHPVWISRHDVEETFSWSGNWRPFYLTAPWANVGLYIETPVDDLEALLDSISSEPVAPSRLALPGPGSGVGISGGNQKPVSSSEPAVVAGVLDRLRALDRPVEADALPCTGAEELTPGLTLAGSDMATIGLSYPSGMPAAQILVSTTDECAFATSSMGGRVWLPEGFYAEIRALIESGADDE